MEKEFKWTDELVKEFIFVNTSPRQSHFIDRVLDDFKKSKSEVKKDYEVLSYSYKNNIYEIDYNINDFVCYMGGRNLVLSSEERHSIYSVKRLSDGEVFTIGDMIEGFLGVDSSPNIIIDKFGIDYFNNSLISAFNKQGQGRSISAWKKQKSLFTPEQ